VTIPPQVIKRGDKYVIHNVDLTGLNGPQRMAYGVEVWDQIRYLMEINGEYKSREGQELFGGVGVGSYEDIDQNAAEAVGCQMSALKQYRPRLLKNHDVLQRAKNGEFHIYKDVGRALGMTIRTTLKEGRPSTAKLKSSYYGKGDKFVEATEPLARYLTAWEKKDFKYPHVPPKEAQRRLRKIDEIMGGLAHVKEDILKRSHPATFKVPS
jgi:hypothetical protein